MSSIAEIDDLATLDALNTAKNEVLSERRWEFDNRHAQLTLKPKGTGFSISASSGDLTASIIKAGVVESDFVGDYITRLRPVGDANYGDTAIRALSGTTLSSSVAAAVMASTAGADISSTEGELIYAEYLLPETVANVISVTHAERDVSLEEVDSAIEFEDLYPNPWTASGPPDVISVGGFDISTYNSTSDAPVPRLRMIVHPVPDAAYVLDYDYTYQHPELTTEITSTLVGVPEKVVDLIVTKAVAAMQRDFDRRSEDGRSLDSTADRKLDEIHSRHRGGYATRKSVGNWDGTASRARPRIAGRIVVP